MIAGLGVEQVLLRQADLAQDGRDQGAPQTGALLDGGKLADGLPGHAAEGRHADHGHAEDQHHRALPWRHRSVDGCSGTGSQPLHGTEQPVLDSADDHPLARHVTVSVEGDLARPPWKGGLLCPIAATASRIFGPLVPTRAMTSPEIHDVVGCRRGLIGVQ